MDKVILFDWGGVVETSEIIYDTMRDVMYSLGFTNVDEKKIYVDFHKESGCSIFDKITDKDEFDRKLKEFLKGFSGNIEVTDDVVKEYKRLYTSVSVNNPYYKEVAKYIYSLKERCEIGILSNVQMIDRERQNSHLNYQNFDYVFLSSLIGLVKPHKEIYEYVQDKLRDKKILFLDDNPNNLVVPSEMGWSVYQVKKGGDIEGIESACEEFIRENN